MAMAFETDLAEANDLTARARMLRDCPTAFRIELADWAKADMGRGSPTTLVETQLLADLMSRSRFWGAALKAIHALTDSNRDRNG